MFCWQKIAGKSKLSCKILFQNFNRSYFWKFRNCITLYKKSAMEIKFTNPGRKTCKNRSFSVHFAPQKLDMFFGTLRRILLASQLQVAFCGLVWPCCCHVWQIYEFFTSIITPKSDSLPRQVVKSRQIICRFSGSAEKMGFIFVT